MRRLEGTALVALMVALTGCPGPQTIRLEPIPRPTGVVARVEGEVERTALALNGGTLVLKLYKAGTQERLSEANISLVGPTLGSGAMRLGTDVSFSPLIPGTYELRVSAPGYKTLVEGNITLEAKQTLERRLELSPAGGTVKGRILAGGSPVWGARVMLGDSWTLTGTDGAFTLSDVGAGAGTLKVRKGGYQGSDTAVTVSGETQAGDVTLTALGRERRIALMNASQPFGGMATTVGDVLNTLLTKAEGASGLTTAPGSPVDIRLLASPKATPSAAEIDELKTFVRGGGTLVVTGEWGGFGDYNPEAVNARTRPFGLVVRPDLVRSSSFQTQSDWVVAGVNAAMPSSQGASGLVTFTGSSVLAAPLAVGLASTGAGGYRVQSGTTGDQTLAAAAPYGEGLVVVLGDTSAWTGDHLEEAGNRQFMLNLFGW